MNQELKKQITVLEKEERRMAERRRDRNNINSTDWDKIEGTLVPYGGQPVFLQIDNK